MSVANWSSGALEWVTTDACHCHLFHCLKQAAEPIGDIPKWTLRVEHQLSDACNLSVRTILKYKRQLTVGLSVLIRIRDLIEKQHLSPRSALYICSWQIKYSFGQYFKMSFVIVSASDVLYGPTALSTEDSVLHEQLSTNVSNGSLTISRRHRRHNVSAINSCENL